MTVSIPDGVVQALLSSHAVVALTGAGISEESGLRTFRDAQTGLWARYRPEDLASPAAFARDPQLVWNWYRWRREALLGVRANAGHVALVQMTQSLRRLSLITQNVDGLHQLAGQPEVIELHGNIRRVRCSVCAQPTETWVEVPGAVPCCAQCGGLLRPDVVWFGEALARRQLECAVAVARACSTFLSIGTSALVQPAASLAHAARNRGATVIEVNREATPLTAKCDFVLRGRTGEILPELAKALRAAS